MRISDWSSYVCSSYLMNAPPPAAIAAHFATDDLIISDVADGKARIWSDFRLHADGFGRARKSVVWGRSVSVRVDLGGRRIIKKKKKRTHRSQIQISQTTQHIIYNCSDF